MKKISLTKNQEDVLEKIIAFSGYATKETIAKYKKITPHSAYELLSTLEKQGYLRSLKYFDDSNKPLIYQVKLKATMELGRGDAYMRKNHSRQAVHKYLIYSHFCFSLLANRNYPFQSILNNTKDRVNFLQKQGLANEQIPQKANYNPKTGTADYILQVEEFILTDPPLALPKGFAIAYAHKPWQPPAGQLATLFERYKSLLQHFSFPVVLIIVGEDKEILLQYQTLFEKKYQQKYKNAVKFLGYSINHSYTT